MKNIEVTWSHIMGRKLSDIRKECGMTQQDLADKVGVSQRTISALLSRKDKGNDDIFTRIGTALGLPTSKIEEMMILSMGEAIDSEYPNARDILYKFYQK